jgi:hypothetical protein
MNKHKYEKFPTGPQLINLGYEDLAKAMRNFGGITKFRAKVAEYRGELNRQKHNKKVTRRTILKGAAALVAGLFLTTPYSGETSPPTYQTAQPAPAPIPTPEPSRLDTVVEEAEPVVAEPVEPVYTPPEVTCYKVMKKNYSDLPDYCQEYAQKVQEDAFALAAKYFREELGINLTFKDANRLSELNHRTKIGIQEIDADQKSDLETLKHEKTLRDLEKMDLSKLTPRDRERMRAQIRNAKLMILHSRRKVYQSNRSTAGEADCENSRVYFVNDIVDREKMKDIMLALATNEITLSSAELMASLTGDEAVRKVRAIRKEEDEKRNYLVKYNARVIAHEICHLSGLWHTQTFKNDNLEEFVKKGTPNLMSYQPIGESEYGFAMTQEQIDQMRSYFTGGQTYKDMEATGFCLEKYVLSQAEEHGYERK